jgi:hypothetical protein
MGRSQICKTNKFLDSHGNLFVHSGEDDESLPDNRP